MPRSVVDEGDRLLVRLPAEPQSAAEARSLVLVACHRWHTDEVCSDTELVMTELIANAVRHAGTEIVVRLALLEVDGGVRAEVSDRSTRPLRPRQPDPFSEGGRGLFLVDTLSSRWGADATTDGKTVWAEILPA